MSDNYDEPKAINIRDLLDAAHRAERTPPPPTQDGPHPEVSTFPTCAECRRHVEEYRQAVLEAAELRNALLSAVGDAERLRDENGRLREQLNQPLVPSDVLAAAQAVAASRARAYGRDARADSRHRYRDHYRDCRNHAPAMAQWILSQERAR